MRRLAWLIGIASVAAAVVFGGLTVLLFAPAGLAQEAAGFAARDPGVAQWGYLSAGLAAGLSALAAGYAVAHVGSASVGAVVEKPELLGRVLVLVGLAEGIAIYGLIVAILILNRLG